MHVITPRGLDSVSLLIIKSLLTAFIAKDGTNSLIKTPFFQDCKAKHSFFSLF